MKKMKKTTSILIAVVMAFGIFTFLPQSVTAATGVVEIDVSTLTEDKDNSTDQTKSQWIYDHTEKGLALLTKGGNYKLTGTKSGLAIWINENLNVTFNELTITSPGNAWVLVITQSANNCKINLEGVSTLITGSGGFTMNAATYIDKKTNCTITSKNGGSLYTYYSELAPTGGSGINMGPGASLNITGNAIVSTMKYGVYGNTGISLSNNCKLNVGSKASLTTKGSYAGIYPTGIFTLINVEGTLNAYSDKSGINDSSGEGLTLSGKGSIFASGTEGGIYSPENIKFGDGLTLDLYNPSIYPNIVTFEKYGTALTYVWKIDGSTTSSSKLTSSVFKTTIPSGSGGTIAREKGAPPKTSISKIAPGAKQMKVTWKKVPAPQIVTKYQLHYRIKGTSKWTTKTYDPSKSSATIKSLKKGKIYQVQVRSYRTVDNKKFYSPWSATKTGKKIK